MCMLGYIEEIIKCKKPLYSMILNCAVCFCIAFYNFKVAIFKLMSQVSICTY